MYQKIIVVGNLGGDPEMRYMPDGRAVTNFSMASNRKWNDKNTGEQVEETTWYRISVWGPQAEATNQYLSRGRRCLVEGRLRPDPTTGGPRIFTRQDGSVGATFEVTADTIKFLGSSNGNGYANDTVTELEEDDVPF